MAENAFVPGVQNPTPEQIEEAKVAEEMRRKAVFDKEYPKWLEAVTRRNALLAAGRPSLAAQVQVPTRPPNWEPIPR